MHESTTEVPGFHPDAERSVGFLLRKATRLVLNDFAARLERSGLSLAQGYVLLDLWREDGRYQRDLAQRMGAHENAMVATVDALEAARLVVRRRGAPDRRRMHVHLSEHGQRLCDDVIRSARETALAAFAGVDPADAETTLRVLRSVVANFDHRAGAEAAS